jgi:predicted nucleotidyltransferase
MFTIPKPEVLNKIISFILDDLEMRDEGLYDIQLFGSYMNGFVDDEGDIDIVFIVEDLYKWKHKISPGFRKKMGDWKPTWQKYWDYKSEHNVDVLMIPKKDYIKVKHLLRHYSLITNKFLYNEEHEYMPSIWPGEIIQPSTADYTLQIKPSKVKKLEQAYKDNKIFFPTKQMEQEWLELLEKKNSIIASEK